MRNDVLYYPFFVPQTNDWLASVLLWWEKLYLIWPEGTMTDNKCVSELIESGVIGTVDPTNETYWIVPQFVETILAPRIRNIAMDPASISESIVLHQGKLGPLLDYLDSVESQIGKRYIKVGYQGVRLDKTIEVPYMSFLSAKLSEKPVHPNLTHQVDTITDDENYIKYFGTIAQNFSKTSLKDRLDADTAVLVCLKDMSINLFDFDQHKIDGLLSFRRDSFQDREKFRDHVAELVAVLRKASEIKGEERADFVRPTVSKLKAGLSELEKKISGTKLRAKIGDLGAVVAGGISAVAGPGVAIGVTVVGIAASETARAHQVREIKTESPLTYLYEVKKTFGSQTLLKRIKRKILR